MFRKFQLSMGRFNIPLSTLTHRLCQCVKRRHYHTPRMTKVISKKGRDSLPLNKKERKRNMLFSKGSAPKTDSMRVCVLKSGAFGGAKSVLLETTHQNYLFNCGEGVQRVLSSSKSKVVQIEDIFLTYKSWENIGGLYGMLMTRAGANKFRGTESVLRIHGPPQVEQVLHMARQFQDSPGVLGDVEKHEISNGSYSNFQMKVEYVKIEKSSVQQLGIKTDQQAAETSKEAQESQEKKQFSCKDDSDFAVAYIIRPKPRDWKFDLAKLADIMSVKTQGPWKNDTAKLVDIISYRSQLSWIDEILKGNPHTLEDGTVLTREEMCFPPEPVPPIVVLECPNEEYLESLIASEQLLKLTKEKDEPQLIVHMTPANIISREEYQMFLKRFKTANHLLLNERSKHYVLNHSMSLQQSLNNLDPVIFPELNNSGEQNDREKPSHSRIIQGETNLKYSLRPYKVHQPGYDWSGCSKLDRDLSIEKSFKDGGDEVRAVVAAWKEQLWNPPEPENRRQYPEVVFLGTASSVPMLTRNVSGILLHLSPEKCMLLDCGENTTEQIRCLYGDQADNVFAKLVAVFISHLHADHHMGLFDVISARHRALESQGLPITRLQTLAPVLLQRWLYMYFRVIKNLFNEIQLIRHVPDPSVTPEAMSVQRSILEKLDLQEFNAIPVNHTPHAYGISLTHEMGWKLCYSGDTTPCQRLVAGGKGCDLLIHEATFSEHLAHEAHVKNHSTVPQAIKIGQEMEAKFIMLTHFSQRYTTVPVLPENMPSNVGIAFDFMKVTLDDLPVVAKLIPVLECMYEQKLVELRYRDKRDKERVDSAHKRKFEQNENKDYTGPLKAMESKKTAGNRNKQKESVSGASYKPFSKSVRTKVSNESKKHIEEKLLFEFIDTSDHLPGTEDSIALSKGGDSVNIKDLENEKTEGYDEQDYDRLENIIDDSSEDNRNFSVSDTEDETVSILKSETGCRDR